MNINAIGKFYLSSGGIGDCLIFLSTFYDSIDEANVIFLANERKSIVELLDCFPKIRKKFVIENDIKHLAEFYKHPNCIGTGILPINLNYLSWKNTNIFNDFGVKEFPEFTNLFSPIRIYDKQIFLQTKGSSIEGNSKQRIISEKLKKEIKEEFSDYTFIESPAIYTKEKPLKYILQLIKGSDIVISVDSFSKTFSAMNKIRTIVYDNTYDDSYLNNFSDRTDAGHFVFIFPWSFIEFRTDVVSHQLSYKKFKNF